MNLHTSKENGTKRHIDDLINRAEFCFKYHTFAWASAQQRRQNESPVSFDNCRFYLLQ